MSATITQVYYNTPGNLPLSSGSFTYNGGALLLTASGSGWASNAAGVIGMTVTINNAVVATSQVYTNKTIDHRAFVPVTVSVNVSELTAGATYTVDLSVLGSTNTDFNDFYNVTVVEIGTPTFSGIQPEASAPASSNLQALYVDVNTGIPYYD